jgi:orotate phosphoribosyltransferase-like protein
MENLITESGRSDLSLINRVRTLLGYGLNDAEIAGILNVSRGDAFLIITATKILE